jgi:anti-anti-sigma factor
MRISGENHGAVLVLALSGRLDSNTSAGLQQDLLGRIRAGEHRVVLDFTATDYVSSAGLRALLMAAKQMDQAGGKLIVCSLAGQGREAFELSGFTGLLKVCAGREEATLLAAS